MSFLGDALGGEKKLLTGGLGVIGHDASSLYQGANKIAGDVAGNPKTGAPSLLNPVTDVSSGAFGRGLSALGIGGKGGPSAPAGPAENYWNNALKTYSTTNGIDPNKLLEYFSATQPGFNPNDLNQVNTAIKQAMSQGWIQPSFLSGTQGGSDPLAQQALFQSTIQPYLQKIANSAEQGQKMFTAENQNLQNEYGKYESPDVKALLGTLDAAQSKDAGVDTALTQQMALSGPGISTIIDALRAQYINQLNNLTTGTGTTAPAKLQAPSTLSAINSALAPQG